MELDTEKIEMGEDIQDYSEAYNIDTSDWMDSKQFCGALKSRGLKLNPCDLYYILTTEEKIILPRMDGDKTYWANKQHPYYKKYIVNSNRRAYGLQSWPLFSEPYIDKFTRKYANLVDIDNYIRDKIDWDADIPDFVLMRLKKYRYRYYNIHKSRLYNDYLHSNRWRKIRDEIVKRDGGCTMCGSDKLLHVHHLTYDHCFFEEKEDLITLCDRCHNFVHGK